eukprot:gene7578-15536_t
MGLIEITYQDGKSRVTRLRGTYPMRFIEASTTNQICPVIFILGFGGGMVSGDELHIQGHIHSLAKACLRTQGSTKIFKNFDSQITSQNFHFHLREGSFLAILPDPVTCFKNADFRQSQIFSLTKTSSLVLVDWYTSGRSSNGEQWAFKRLNNQIKVYIEDKLIFLENLELQNTAMGTVADKVGHMGVFGTVLFVGPKTTLTEEMEHSLQSFQCRQSFRQKLTESILHPSPPLPSTASSASASASAFTTNHVHNNKSNLGTEPLISVSRLAVGVTVLRFATMTTEEAYVLLKNILSPLQMELGFVPYADRIHHA